MNHPLERCLALAPGDDEAFTRAALEAFAEQREGCAPYRDFCAGLGVRAPRSWREVPALPVEVFRGARPVTSFPAAEAEAVFRTSGTTAPGVRRGERHVARLADYERAAWEGWRRAFGERPVSFVAVLPGYDERPDSSLVAMVAMLSRRLAPGTHASVPPDPDAVRAALAAAAARGPVVLFGAAFALLDLAERGGAPPFDGFVLETGGMKTHRREIGRAALHDALRRAFGAPVGSEYGMTELLSQAYAAPDSNGVFSPPPWMRVRAMEPRDPTREVAPGEQGILAVHDLASHDAVCAVQTRDVGRLVEGGFTVEGRLAGAELRGCNFLFE